MKDVGEAMNKELDQGSLRQQLREIQDRVLSDEEVQAFIRDHRDQLDAEKVGRSLSKLYEYCQERDRIKGGQDPKFPNFTPRLIMNKNYIDVEYVPTDEYLQHQAQTEREERVQLLELPSSLRQASFADFDTSDSARQKALTKALDFVEGLTANPDGFQRGLYLYGPFGVGKTYILAAIANRLADSGFETTLLHYPTFLTEMKDLISKNGVQSRVREISRVQILVIDDIGAESNTAWGRDDILGVILQARMNENRPTCFSSNFNMQELENHLAYSSQGNVEEVKAGRIMERIRYLAEEVAMGGRNRRHD